VRFDIERLTRCETCGELKGELLDSEDEDEDDPVWIMECLCDGVVCTNCGKGRMHRPLSNFYDEEAGHPWHVPAFAHLKPCGRCGASGSSTWVRAS
jgi:hypothetical protein